MEEQYISDIKFHFSYLPKEFKLYRDRSDFFEISQRNSINRDFYSVEEILDFIAKASQEELDGHVWTYYYSPKRQGYKQVRVDTLRHLNINENLKMMNEKLGTDKFAPIENYKPYEVINKELVLTPEIQVIRDFFNFESTNYNGTDRNWREILNTVDEDDLIQLIETYGKDQHIIKFRDLEEIYDTGDIDITEYKDRLMNIIANIRSEYNPQTWPFIVTVITSDEFHRKMEENLSVDYLSEQDIAEHGKGYALMEAFRRRIKHHKEMSGIKDSFKNGAISEEEYSSKVEQINQEYLVKSTYPQNGAVQDSEPDFSSEMYWLSLRAEELENAVHQFLCNKYPTANITLTDLSNDGGVDIFLEEKIFSRKLAIQCKGYGKPAGRPDCQQAYGAAQFYNSTAVIICPAGFTEGAKEYAKKVNLMLMNASDLVKLSKGNL